MDRLIPPIAAANAVIAQVTEPNLESWVALLSKLSATAVLAFACYLLWRKNEQLQVDRETLRREHADNLRGVLTETHRIMQRSNDVLERLEKKL